MQFTGNLCSKIHTNKLTFISINKSQSKMEIYNLFRRFWRSKSCEERGERNI